ncbi:MAG: reverse transcriptase/maturase family protein [Ruminococcus flavefaciens]|nr:reverse transcriptase/maturase family protein [Ruminococcus flavefaciens]
MKSYNHLWELYLSEENIMIAIQNSSKGKRNRKKVKKIYENPEDYVEYFQEYGEYFHNYKHIPIDIFDGISRKKRQIIVPEYDEQVIHHMATNILIPIFSKGMYEHVYGSLPKRGAHAAKKRIEKWIQKDPKNCKYCLKMDIKKYFNSIPHDILEAKLARVIHDKKFLKLMHEIIGVQPDGIPLGFYTSQWLANWYLQGLDHYIKEDLEAVHYIRYMDDMVIFGPNKKKLHKIRRKIEEYLENELGLKMKENHQVFRFDYTKKGERRGRHLDFMGFKFY